MTNLVSLPFVMASRLLGAKVRRSDDLRRDRAEEAAIKGGSPAVRPEDLDNSYMAPTADARAASLHDVLSLEKENLRGITLSSLLGGFGRLFADGGKAARDDPHGTYATSHPVDSLGYFVSHSWRSPRLVKYLAMLLFFNRRDAATAMLCAVAFAAVPIILHYESLPEWASFVGPNTYSDFEQVRIATVCTSFGYLAFFGGLYGAHRVRQAVTKPVECFLDVACIRQDSDDARAQGIASLGALLDRSERMLVLLDKEYFTRLWCVFELAAFAKRAGMHRVEIVQLHAALIEWTVLGIWGCINVIFVILGPWIPTSNEGFGLFFIPIFVPLTIVQFRAFQWAHASQQAVDQLRNFRLQDALCQGEEDRAAILGLIAAWYSDTSVELPPDELVRLGHHRFEQFVRFDVRLAVERELVKVGFTHTAIVGAAIVNSIPALDTLAHPDMTLYDCLGTFASCLLYYGITLRIFGWSSYACARLGSLISGRSVVLSYVVSMLVFLVAFWVTGVSFNPIQAPGKSYFADFVEPDDGLEPEQRKQAKVQLVVILFAMFGALGPRM